MRAANPQLGIILLTAKTQESDKVTGFMSGADDYITKPFFAQRAAGAGGRALPPPVLL